MASVRFAKQAAALARRSSVLRELKRKHGVPEFPVRRQSAFSALARAIVYQQLGAGAASTIWGRFESACQGRVCPEAVASLPDDRARSAGLSGGKWRAVRALESAVASGELKLRGLSRLDDDAVRAQLVAVKGIGPWTANMFLMFHLQRLDVWPTGDLGVRKGYARAWGLADMPSPRELAPMADDFRPYRSLVAWYCWRAADA